MYIYSLCYDDRKLYQIATLLIKTTLSTLLEKGVLREHSVHYQYLITSWIVTCYLFSSAYRDIKMEELFKSYLLELFNIIKFFSLTNSYKGEVEFPLIGDISPDCSVNWVSNLFFKRPFENSFAGLVDPFLNNDIKDLICNNHKSEKKYSFINTDFHKINSYKFTLFISSGINKFSSNHMHEDLLMIIMLKQPY